MQHIEREVALGNLLQNPSYDEICSGMEETTQPNVDIGLNSTNFTKITFVKALANHLQGSCAIALMNLVS